MFDELMLHGDRLYRKAGAGADKVYLKLRFPWYRGLPVSCIERLEITVDGVPQKDVKLLIGGVPLSQPELAKRVNETWFNLDAKEAELSFDAPLAEGKHDVYALMRLRIPYNRTNPDPTQSCYTQYAVCKKEMVLEGGDE